MRELYPSQGNILLRKVRENHTNVQLVKPTPPLSHSKRNPKELLGHVREILVNSGKNESNNARFAYDCSEFFESRA